MPSGPITQDILRSRAIALREVAKRLDGAASLDLYKRSGPDVWEGATPRQCHEELLTARWTVVNAAADLRRGARVLDQRASQLTPAPVGTAR